MSKDKAKKVKLPNGLEIHSDWYEPPTYTRRGTLRNYEADLRLSKKAFAEQIRLWRSHLTGKAT